METNTISALSAKFLPKFTISIPKSPIKSLADYGILASGLFCLGDQMKMLFATEGGPA